MIAYSKTIRFRNTHRDQEALDVLNHYLDFGYASANELVIAALYEMKYKAPASNLPHVTAEELVEMIATRLDNHSYHPREEGKVPSITSWDTPNPADDKQLGDIFADILSM